MSVTNQQLFTMLGEVREQLQRVEKALAARGFKAPDRGRVCEDAESVPIIIRRCEDAFGLARGTVATKSREDRVVCARHAAIHLAKRATALTNKNLGPLFGMEQSSISYGLREVADRRQMCADFDGIVRGLEAEFPGIALRKPRQGGARHSVRAAAVCGSLTAHTD